MPIPQEKKYDCTMAYTNVLGGCERVLLPDAIPQAVYSREGRIGKNYEKGMYKEGDELGDESGCDLGRKEPGKKVEMGKEEVKRKVAKKP